MDANKKTLLGSGVLAFLLALGCAQAPSQQLEAAQKAVEAARAAGAVDYVKEEWTKLEQELSQAKEEMAYQERALAIFRSYRKANEILARVITNAKQVEATAQSRKEEAKTAAVAREKEAQEVVASAKGLVAKAPVGKDRAAVESIKQDLAGLQAGLGEIHHLIDQGDYLGAEARAKALKEKGLAVSTEIQGAIKKVGKAKGGSRHGS